MELIEGRASVEDVDEFVVRLDAIGEEHDCVVVGVDARYMVDRAHGERALALAKRAFDRDQNVADRPAIEGLLYLAGRRQIDQALDIGVGAGERPVVILIDDWDSTSEKGRDDLDASNGSPTGRERTTANAIERELDMTVEPGDVLGEYDEQRIREWFGIGDRELAATEAGIADLVHERVALLDVEK